MSQVLFKTIASVFRQSFKYQLLVEEHLHHGDICSSLCDNLLASFNNGLELAEQIKHDGLQVGISLTASASFHTWLPKDVFFSFEI